LEHEILQELQSFAPKHTDTELRSILGSFLFTGDDVFKKIKVLSGGEKSRVALAKALTADANFLILDEPTNHLDMASVNILIQALQQYEGTVIVVSHDRYFLDNVANKIWFIEDQKIKQYPGTYAEYDEWNC
jgi:ATP-binding cassette subfamily F protein 3